MEEDVDVWIPKPRMTRSDSSAGPLELVQQKYVIQAILTSIASPEHSVQYQGADDSNHPGVVWIYQPADMRSEGT